MISRIALRVALCVPFVLAAMANAQVATHSGAAVQIACRLYPVTGGDMEHGLDFDDSKLRELRISLASGLDVESSASEISIEDPTGIIAGGAISSFAKGTKPGTFRAYAKDESGYGYLIILAPIEKFEKAFRAYVIKAVNPLSREAPRPELFGSCVI